MTRSLYFFMLCCSRAEFVSIGELQALGEKRNYAFKK